MVKNQTLARTAPFVLFMSWIALEEILRSHAIRGIVGVSDHLLLWIYPCKAFSTALLLFLFRRNYSELRWRDLSSLMASFTAVATGIFVFLLWIRMDWSWATTGTPQGYNPTLVSDYFTFILLISCRLFGAALIVPVMEEIFWRSWLSRYLISQNFQSVDLGRFTLASFVIGTLLFGLEHNLWLAGILAGASYNILLYRSKSLAQCVIAHAVTNLLLGLFVLQTGRWEFW